MRLGQADTTAKDTQYAGLPKAARLWNSVSQAAPTINVSTVLQFDTLAYNYGGFALHYTGGVIDGFIVPETGIYTVIAGCQIVTIAGNREFVWPQINGTTLGGFLPDNQGQSFTDVGFPADTPSFSDRLMCHANDVLTVGFFYTGAAGIGNFVAGASRLYVQKEGGLY